MTDEKTPKNLQGDTETTCPSPGGWTYGPSRNLCECPGMTPFAFYVESEIELRGKCKQCKGFVSAEYMLGYLAGRNMDGLSG